MNLVAETASLELRAAAFAEHGAVAVSDLVAEDVVQLMQLIAVDPADVTVNAGVLTDLHHETRSVAPSVLCSRTFEEVQERGLSTCACGMPAFLHRSAKDA